MNLNFNRLLFYMFWKQNSEKTFDDFGILGGNDKKYSGIKLKDFNTINYGINNHHAIMIELKEDSSYLCAFKLNQFEFDGFNIHSVFDIDILDYISFEDKI